MRLAARVRELLLPPDRSTEDGRSQARHRAITLTALTSAFARGISILTALVSIPLTLHYLGVERYGMWMTLSAFTMLLSFTDFGIGNSVLTAVAQSSGKADDSELKRQIASAYAAMSGVAAIMLAFLLLAYGLVPWSQLFNVTTLLAVAEAGPSSAVFFTVLALTTPLTLVYRIQLGLQEGFLASLWQSVGNVAALAALVVATQLEASLPWLVLALAGTPVVVAMINMFHFFVLRRPDLRPRIALIDGQAMRKLASGGALFLILQICAAVMFQSNAIIIAQLLGSEAVATFAIPDRMFAMVGVILSLVLTPLWPAYGEAAARGDIAWVRRTFWRSLVVAVSIALVLAVIFVLLGPTLIYWWVGDAVAPPFALIAALGTWKVIEAAGNSIAMFLNGVNEIAIQAMFAITTAIATVVLRIWWVQDYGLPGAMFGIIVPYSLLAIPFLGYAIYHALERIEARHPA